MTKEEQNLIRITTYVITDLITKGYIPYDLKNKAGYTMPDDETLRSIKGFRPTPTEYSQSIIDLLGIGIVFFPEELLLTMESYQ